MERNDVTKAVRSLRKRLGDTQQQFSDRLGVALSTAIRYERNRPPKGPTLSLLQSIAASNGFAREAEVFKRAGPRKVVFILDGLEEYTTTMGSLAGSTSDDARLEDLLADLQWAIKVADVDRLEQQLGLYRRARKAYALQIEDAWNRFSTANRLIDSGISVNEAARRSSLAHDVLRSSIRLSKKMPTIRLRRLMFDVGLEPDDAKIASQHKVPKRDIQSVRKVLMKMQISASGGTARKKVGVGRSRSKRSSGRTE